MSLSAIEVGAGIPPSGEPDLSDFGFYFPGVQDTTPIGEFRLPGRGDPGADCGEFRDFWCPHCDQVVQVKHHCAERECPDCGKSIWASREGNIARARISDGRRHYRLKAHHVIISFDPKQISLANLEYVERYMYLRTLAYAILRYAGAKGGFLVFHPWREDKFGGFTEDGMHFHAIVLGRWILPGDEVVDHFCKDFSKDQWLVVKRVPDFKPRSNRTYKYLLEHCGIHKGMHAITWWGNMSRVSFKPGEEEIAAKNHKSFGTCPTCGGELEPLECWDYTAYPAEFVGSQG